MRADRDDECRKRGRSGSRRCGMIRRVASIIRLLWIGAGLALFIWALGTSPFAQPFAERSLAEIRLAIDRAVARDMTSDWLRPRLAEAIADDDPDRVTLLLDLGVSRGITLPADERAAAEALIAAHDGALATVADCGSCAVDIGSCRSVALISACALPFELSPLGDLTALGRAGTDWMTGSDVDEVDAGLAALGLTATAATLASGGTSLTVKYGATVLRLARKLGALPPGMVRAMRAAAVAGDGGAAMGRIAGDIGRLRDATSTAETLTLLRLADTPGDLSRLARVAEAAGPDTRKAVEVLGKARTLRVASRLSDAVLGIFWLAAWLAAQAAALLGSLLGWVVRPLTRPARSRPSGRSGRVA
jgi:hypothetical protein